MDLLWINASEKLKNAVKTVNKIDDSSFNTILECVLQKHLESKEISSDLLEKLEEVKNNSNFTEQEFASIINTVQFMVKKVLKFVVAPSKLQCDLNETIGLDEIKTEKFLKFYKNTTKEILENLEEKDGVTNQLENVVCDLKVQLASSAQEKEKTALGIVQLQNKFGDPVNMEMNHAELLQFFNQLENIQMELDLLKK